MENQEKNQNEILQEGENTEIVAAEQEQKALANPSKSYVTKILQDIKEDFVKVNEELDMDFVYMGDWLTINKKGQFVEKDGDQEVQNFGESIDVVIGYGEKRWTLWGEQKSPEEGMLIVAEREEEDAKEKLAAWLEENPEAQARYSPEDVELRYLAYVVPVESLSADDMPQIYLMSFPKTATIAYGKWAMKIYKGKYKNINIPARTPINQVVARISTSEKEGKGSNSYIGIDFEAVGLFKPEEYGINTEQ